MLVPTPSRGKAAVVLGLLTSAAAAQRQEPIGLEMPAEVVDTSEMTWVVESMDVVLARDVANPPEAGTIRRMRPPGQVGEWELPSFTSALAPRSGEKYAYNRWGDLEMSIDLPALATVEGAYIAGHGQAASWASSLTVVGYAAGVEVARTGVFTDIDEQPTWFAMDLAGVDRVVFEAGMAVRGGWFALDDLSFTVAGERTVLDFESLEFRDNLTTGSAAGYGGLSWNPGGGNFPSINVVPPPQAPPGALLPPVSSSSASGGGSFLGGGGTLPTLGAFFRGPWINDIGAGSIPPDTCGAAGPNHVVAVVNSNLSVYDKQGNRLLNTSLQSFFNGLGGGDPRIAFDHYDNRWIVIMTNFDQHVRLAYSSTDDPLGSWFKTNLDLTDGVDAGDWIDYPTLGVSEDGIFTAMYMVGGQATMSLFAIEKAPLLGGTLGNIRAWRNLAWEGAIQPCVQYGSPGFEYLTSTNGNNRLRMRRITGPMTAPTLATIGFANISTFGSAGDAPQLGGPNNIDSPGTRLMNAVYRNGSVWTAHTINRNGRAAVRWYEVTVPTVSLAQQGTIEDSSLWYYCGSIAVNAANDVGLGFTGSSTSTYPGCYYTGRLGTDPSGQVATPVQYRAGNNNYELTFGGGVNRWGDYSLTSVDPADDTTIWTIQEYVRTGDPNPDTWGTYWAELQFPVPCPTPTTYCVGAINSTGFGSSMAFAGSASISANDGFLSAHLAPAGQFGIFYYGPNQIQTAFGNGFRCVGGQTVRLPLLTTDAFGSANLALDLTSLPNGDTVSPGETVNVQFWYRDPAGGAAAFNLSDALSISFCP